jgi:hypothetical protein
MMTSGGLENSQRLAYLGTWVFLFKAERQCGKGAQQVQRWIEKLSLPENEVDWGSGIGFDHFARCSINTAASQMISKADFSLTNSRWPSTTSAAIEERTRFIYHPFERVLPPAGDILTNRRH